MADIITWTTPTLTEAVEGVDLTDMDLYITIEQISPSGSLRARLTASAEGEYDGTDTYRPSGTVAAGSNLYVRITYLVA